MKAADKKALLIRVMTQLIETKGFRRGPATFALALHGDREVKVLVPESIKTDASAEELETYWLGKLRAAIDGKNCDTAGYCTLDKSRTTRIQKREK